MDAFLNECLTACVSRGQIHAPEYNTKRTEVDGSHPKADRGSRVVPPVYNSVTEAIGNTPIFRLHKIEKKYNLQCEFYVKAEFMSVGGSVKDRIARRMIEVGESEGSIKPGDVVIEATSGNTGIGLALMCAARGYQMVVVMPEKMSAEKANTLKALGAKVIRTRTSASWSDDDSHIVTAYRLMDEINSRCENTGIRAFLFDQYQATGNLLAHYQETAQEILDQLDNKVDVLVAGTGTGGTMTGVAQKLKEALPNCRVVGVDPEGSLLHFDRSEWHKHTTSPYEVEGIGYDFMPPVCHTDLVDDWEVVNDKDAFNRAREVVALEGLLLGGSCGCALEAGVRVARTLESGKRLVVILPDSIRNYLTKYASDNWMQFNGFKPVESGSDKRSVRELMDKAHVVPKKLKDLVQMDPKTPCIEAYKMLKDGRENAGIMREGEGEILGFITLDDLIPILTRSDGNPQKPIDEITSFKSFFPISYDLDATATTLVVEACRMGSKQNVALIVLMPSLTSKDLDAHANRLKFKDLKIEEALDCEFLTVSQQLDILAARF